MKIGRNDPCPCGSGEKYKKCCLGKQTLAESAHVHYRRLSDVHDKLTEKLAGLADTIYGKEVLAAAMDEFLAWPESDEGISEGLLDRQQALFWPWFLFNWELEPDNEYGLEGPTERTLPELYMEKAVAGLDDLEHKMILAANRKSFSFWEATAVDPGRHLDLRDVLTGETMRVLEKAGSEYINKGDILFARAVLVDGVGMLIGLGGTLIPQNYKPDLIMMRKTLRGEDAAVNEETLYDWDVEIRGYYLQIDRRLHEPPQLTNTDGDPLEFHRLAYAIDNAETVFECLAGLEQTRTPEDLRRDADLDEQGHIQNLDFSWVRLADKQSADEENILMGVISLRPDTVTVEVNSAERAKAARKEIEGRLGNAARFKSDDIRDLGSIMAAMEGRDGSYEQKQDALKQDPGIRQVLARKIAKHWREWVDQAIPALENQTPREAVRTADGREAVEALLATAEKAIPGDALLTELNRKGVAEAKSKLRLD